MNRKTKIEKLKDDSKLDILYRKPSLIVYIPIQNSREYTKAVSLNNAYFMSPHIPFYINLQVLLKLTLLSFPKFDTNKMTHIDNENIYIYALDEKQNKLTVLLKKEVFNKFKLVEGSIFYICINTNNWQISQQISIEKFQQMQDISNKMQSLSGNQYLEYFQKTLKESFQNISKLNESTNEKDHNQLQDSTIPFPEVFTSTIPEYLTELFQFYNKFDFHQFKDSYLVSTYTNLFVKDKSTRNIRLNSQKKLKETIYTKLQTNSLPFEKIKLYDAFTRSETYMRLHFPKSIIDAQKALETLMTEELFLLVFALKEHYSKLTIQQSTEKLSFKFQDFSQDIINSLNKDNIIPTSAQIKCTKEIIQEIYQDLQKNILIFGDVGSGKSIVMLLLIDFIARNGYSCLIATPSTLLTMQHLKFFSEHLKYKIYHISSTTQKIDISAQCFIGTLACLRHKSLLEINNLAFVFIDEEHKIGVEDKTLANIAHGLLRVRTIFLTATPIPRTLGKGLSGALEIKELPPRSERTNVISKVVPCKDEIMNRLFHQVLKNQSKTLIIVKHIESNWRGLFNLSTIQQFINRLCPGLLKHSLILHGQMKTNEINEVYETFTNDKSKFTLISTNIIEVGLNIRGLNTMFIFDADEYGLTQLHQSRGRIGRYGEKAELYLVTRTESGNDRINFFAKTIEIDKLAKYDMKHRGIGDLARTTQSGKHSFLHFYEQADLLEMLENPKFTFIYEMMQNLTEKEKRELLSVIQVQEGF